MLKYKIVQESKITEFSTLIQAENFALSNAISLDSIASIEVDTTVEQTEVLRSAINSKIRQFQEAAPSLMRELYVENTMAGISTAQSDAIFDDFSDVLIRIKEGAFPTALYRLNQKQPSGFVTQALIDAWKAKLISYMV
jgi:hypothetical protein